MSNPYEPPISDLESEKRLLPKAKWKVLFWITLILGILSLINMFSDPEESLYAIISEIAIYSFIISGLYGFSYNKKILNKKLWVYLIPIDIAFEIYNISNYGWHFKSSEEMYFVVAFVVVVGIPLLFFQYLALFKYSLRSSEIWG